MKKTEIQQNTVLVARPPVVVVMGHIDHGKSTLLDYIRKTNVTDGEAGGITQHMSAYEVTHKNDSGEEKNITFLDTPGHEAFQSLRDRGAKIADIAILVVSAEDGVKPQTLEALQSIKKENIPYVVAINKIDRPNADVERTKQSLAENEIYIEGYGGEIPAVAISAKTGDGIPELLSLILLVAELGEFKANSHLAAEGIVLESSLDPKKGIFSTLIITNGTLNKGMFVAAPGSYAPIRHMEDSHGNQIEQATFSKPIRITGWDSLVPAGSPFKSFEKREEALLYKQTAIKKEISRPSQQTQENPKLLLPVIIKADTMGSLEAITYELKKVEHERIEPLVVSATIGPIGEADIKLAQTKKDSVVIGFNTKIDTAAVALAERDGIPIQTFSIIYKLAEWLQETLITKAPKRMVEQVTGSAKIIKIFSKARDKQIIGGKVENGFLKVGEMIKIMRRESEIGQGKIRGLQQQKREVNEVKEGLEFGGLVESKIEIAPHDKLVSVEMIET